MVGKFAKLASPIVALVNWLICVLLLRFLSRLWVQELAFLTHPIPKEDLCFTHKSGHLSQRDSEDKGDFFRDKGDNGDRGDRGATFLSYPLLPLPRSGGVATLSILPFRGMFLKFSV